MEPVLSRIWMVMDVPDATLTVLDMYRERANTRHKQEEAYQVVEVLLVWGNCWRGAAPVWPPGMMERK
jgi:hypothetical protein